MVLSLVGGTAPHKFHTCIHRTLRCWSLFLPLQIQDICIYNYILYWCTNERGEPNRRTPETDSPNPWGWIKPRSGTPVLKTVAAPQWQTNPTPRLRVTRIEKCYKRGNETTRIFIFFCIFSNNSIQNGKKYYINVHREGS